MHATDYGMACKQISRCIMSNGTSHSNTLRQAKSYDIMLFHIPTLFLKLDHMISCCFSLVRMHLILNSQNGFYLRIHSKYYWIPAWYNIHDLQNEFYRRIPAGTTMNPLLKFYYERQQLFQHESNWILPLESQHELELILPHNLTTDRSGFSLKFLPQIEVDPWNSCTNKSWSLLGILAWKKNGILLPNLTMNRNGFGKVGVTQSQTEGGM